MFNFTFLFKKNYYFVITHHYHYTQIHNARNTTTPSSEVVNKFRTVADNCLVDDGDKPSLNQHHLPYTGSVVVGVHQHRRHHFDGKLLAIVVYLASHPTTCPMVRFDYYHPQNMVCHLSPVLGRQHDVVNWMTIQIREITK